MKFEFITPQVVHFKYPSQYHVCSAFLRIQEFYESPDPQFNGQFFTMDEYMDWYAEQSPHKVFSYFEDWSGFNIPGHIVDRFYSRYTPMCLRPKEQAIIKVVKPLMDAGMRFYIIGSTDDADQDLIDHELRHAAYYIDEKYRDECEKIYKSIPEDVLTAVHKRLKKYGYSHKVWADETQAYFSTDTVEVLQCRFETDFDLAPYANAYAALKID